MRLARLAASLVIAAVASGCADEPAPRAPTARPLIDAELRSDELVEAALIARYTKSTYFVRMRDGVRLFTTAYAPKELHPDRPEKWPILLVRTPYGVPPYAVDAAARGARVRRIVPSAELLRAGYIFVAQEVRGTGTSEGTFEDVRPAGAKGQIDESTDAWDTVDWLVKNVANNNGSVGLWGVSYPGFYAAQALIDAHPAVKAVSPQAPVTEWFLGDDDHHNGAFFLAETFDFYADFGRPRKGPTKKWPEPYAHEVGDAYDFFLRMGPLSNADKLYFKGEVKAWSDIMAHGTRDAFWQARDPRPRLRDVKPAVMTVGGWFDKEDLFGTLATHRAIERQSPRTERTLVMGPWSHGGWRHGPGDRLGDVAFGAPTGDFFRARIELPFFERHLRGGGDAGAVNEAWIFETGTNEWRVYGTWPPTGAKAAKLFLGPHGALRAAPGKGGGFDAYVSDPRAPVPYMEKPGADVDEDFMSADQRFASRRPDVLAYTTPELASDVTLDGPLEASLTVAISGTDADFVVKLVDVYPDDAPNMAGYQALVRGEVMRGKFRTAFDKPSAFVPDQPTVVRFAIPDVAHTFRVGHRIQVQVQSSWFPLVDRNPQTFCDIYHAVEGDFRAATHRVFHDASWLSVTVGRGALP